jgi:outer membrane murein-binding lipoprotein Lpp
LSEVCLIKNDNYLNYPRGEVKKMKKMMLLFLAMSIWVISGCAENKEMEVEMKDMRSLFEKFEALEEDEADMLFERDYENETVVWAGEFGGVEYLDDQIWIHFYIGEDEDVISTIAKASTDNYEILKTYEVGDEITVKGILESFKTESFLNPERNGFWLHYADVVEKK